MKKPNSEPTPKNRAQPIRSRDVPATAGMLYELRDELIKRFDALDSKIDGVHCELDKKIDGVYCKLDNKIDGVGSGLKADNHQLKILVEEQNARNVFTIDQMNSLFHRQDRIEKKVDESL